MVAKRLPRLGTHHTVPRNRRLSCSLGVPRETRRGDDRPAGGGRSWWAQLAFTRINSELTILKKEIEKTLCQGLLSSGREGDCESGRRRRHRRKRVLRQTNQGTNNKNESPWVSKCLPISLFTVEKKRSITASLLKPIGGAYGRHHAPSPLENFLASPPPATCNRRAHVLWRSWEPAVDAGLGGYHRNTRQITFRVMPAPQTPSALIDRAEHALVRDALAAIVDA